MDVQYVKDSVDEMKTGCRRPIENDRREVVGTVWDNEKAHRTEDIIHQQVLRAIAEGKCDAPAALAREALRTLDYDFHRWYA